MHTKVYEPAGLRFTSPIIDPTLMKQQRNLTRSFSWSECGSKLKVFLEEFLFDKAGYGHDFAIPYDGFTQKTQYRLEHFLGGAQEGS